jgi:tetratricopeptide (TPR) repeat protein
MPVLTVLGGSCLGVLLIGFAELTARIVDPPSEAEKIEIRAREFQAWEWGPCYKAQGDRLVRIPPPASPQGDDHGFPLVKAPGVKRIVVVGESTGEMLGDRLARLVEASGCSDKVEVLQCGVDGARPAVAVRRARDALAWSPDIIVVAIGHNFGLPGPAGPTQLIVNRSRLAHEVYRFLPPKLAAPTTVSDDPLESTDLPRIGREAYRQILAAAQGAHVGVVALVLASNLWFRPNPERDYIVSRPRAAAWVKWARGDLNGAVATLSGEPDGALRAFERASFQAQLGEWDAARASLQRARDLEASPTRASSAITAAIRQAAQEGGARIVDFESLLSRLDPHAIPGWDVFFDNCHPYPQPLDLMARATLRAAAPDEAMKCLARPVAPPALDHQFDDPYLRLTYGPFSVRPQGDPETIARTTYPDDGGWRRVVDGPFSLLFAREPAAAASILDRFERDYLPRFDPAVRAAMLDAIGATARDAGRLDIARRALEQSKKTAPTVPGLVNLALLHLRARDDAAARADLDEAGRLDPSDAEVAELKHALDAEAQRRSP